MAVNFTHKKKKKNYFCQLYDEFFFFLSTYYILYALNLNFLNISKKSSTICQHFTHLISHIEWISGVFS